MGIIPSSLHVDPYEIGKPFGNAHEYCTIIYLLMGIIPFSLLVDPYEIANPYSGQPFLLMNAYPLSST
jgi:hypothetical protein